MTIQQQRALAMASARLRMKQSAPPPMEKPAFEREAEETLSTTTGELIAGSAPMRFALGAASPVLGAAQIGAEALGFDGVSKNLRQLEDMKKRGMKAYGNDPVSEAVGLDETTDVVGTGGAVLSPAVLAVMKYLKPAASIGGRVGQGAGVGAGFGASTPVTEGENYWGTKAAQTATGATVGAAIPASIDAGKFAYKLVRNVVDPLLPGGAERSAARMVAEAIKGKRPEVERLLRENKQFVPGSQPTAAEAAAPSQSTGLAGLQNLVEKKFPDQFRGIDVGQEAARRASISKFSGNKDLLAGAVSKRAGAASKAYGAVADDVVGQVDDALLNRPAMQAAMARAKNLSANQGREWGGTVQDYQNLKMALDDMVKDPATFGMGASEAQAINKTRAAFVEWLNKASPGWEAARTKYAADSVPINRMQVGKELENSLTNTIGTAERPGVFAGAVQNAPRTIKRATGSPRFDDIDQIDPQLGEAARNVLSDLNRKSTADLLGRLGQNRAAEITGPAGLPATGPLNQNYMIFKTVLGRISKGTNEQSMEKLAEALQTPQGTLDLLRKVPSEQRQEVVEAILAQKFGRGATIGATTMAAEQEQF